MTQIQGQSGLGVTLTKVSNVQSQVVNGINYKMVLHFADSDDKKCDLCLFGDCLCTSWW